jgi:YD repeat-containing protein
MAVKTMIDDPLFVDEEIPLREAVVRDNRVRSITGRTFETRDGSREAEGFRSHLLQYNTSGKRVRQERYNRAGATVYEWIYDEQGKTIREIAYQDPGEINYQIESIYDHQDQWSEKRMLLPDGRLNWRIVPQRNTEGMLLKCVYYNSQDQILRSDVYIYDEQGRLMTLDMGDFGEWNYQYDEAGNLTRKTGNLASASILGETFEFHYDARSLLVQRDHLNYEVTVFDYGFGD